MSVAPILAVVTASQTVSKDGMKISIDDNFISLITVGVAIAILILGLEFIYNRFVKKRKEKEVK